MRDNRLIVWAALVVSFGLVVLGCEDRATGPEPGASAAPKPVVMPSGDLEKLEAPADVIFFVGSDDLTKLAAKLQRMAGPAGHAVKADSIAQGIAARFRLQDPKLLAINKPARLVLVDPKTHKDGILILTVSDKAKLLAALKDKKDDDAGNAHSFSSAGARKTYLNFLDDFAVFTNEPALFGKLRPFLLKVCGAKVNHGATGVVVVEHAAKIYKQEIDGAGKAPTFASLGKEAIADLVDGVSRLTIHADGIDDGGKLTIEVATKKDGKLRKTVESLAGDGSFDLLSAIPADAPLVAAMRLSPDAPTELTRTAMGWSLQMGDGKGLDKKYLDAADAYWRATDGQVAFAAHMLEGEEELRLSGISTIRDGEAARSAKKILDEMHGDEAFKKKHEELGIKTALKRDAYKVGDVSVTVVKTELEEAKASDADLKKTLGTMAKTFGDLASSHQAISDKLGFISYGADPKPAITAWIEGGVQGGFDKTPLYARAMKHAAKGTFALAYASPIHLVRHFAKGTQPPQTAPAPTAGIAITAGAVEGDLQIVIDIPTAQATALAMAALTMGL